MFGLNFLYYSEKGETIKKAAEEEQCDWWSGVHSVESNDNISNDPYKTKLFHTSSPSREIMHFPQDPHGLTQTFNLFQKWVIAIYFLDNSAQEFEYMFIFHNFRNEDYYYYH